MLDDVGFVWQGLKSVLSAFRLKHMAVDPTVIDLQKTYQPLVTTGMTSTFQAMYQGEFIVPHTGNPRDVLLVGQGIPFSAILSEVSNAVLNLTHGKQGWKGITDREDSPNYNEYWLWGEPGFNTVLQLQVGRPYNYKITECMPFPCGCG